MSGFLDQLPPVIAKPIARLMELDQESLFALADIAAERVRQVEAEGWTPEHDDRHNNSELACAAAYALAPHTHSRPTSVLPPPRRSGPGI